jgi:uncharacterized membrane protein
MLKLAVAVLTLALSAVAGAAGWSSLRIDASSEAAFQQSLAVFQERLSPARRQVFGQALLDIWRQGKADADAKQREYTATDYQRQLHGLSYDEVVTFTDPTGATAKARQRDAQRGQAGGTPVSSWQKPFDAGQRGLTPRAHRELDRGTAVQASSMESTHPSPRSTGQCIAADPSASCR